MTPADLARELQDLIAALDRRVPHLERADETVIARDAAALRELAVQRLHELEARSSGAGLQDEGATRKRAAVRKGSPDQGPGL